MDVIFDIDGTLANAEHRLHHIIVPEGHKKNWDAFLSDEMVAKDVPIPETWETMLALLLSGSRVIFITGRPDSQRKMTTNWIMNATCGIRAPAAFKLADQVAITQKPLIYMRETGDRRPSETTKEEGLIRARKDGWDPKMVFEDRVTDTAMWRRNGLLCCQVAEGNY